MPTITFIQPDGSPREVMATVGHSLMETARDNGVVGIVAECNGSLACATCHAYLPDDLAAELGEPTGDEADMLDFTAADRTPCSRLSCQVNVTAAMDGIVVTLPDTQV